jgi:hypothetical protein
MSRGTLSAVAVAVGLLCLNLSGCMIIASDAPEAHCPNTLGKELRDLKVARDDGAVSNDEYHAAKDKLLATYGRQ